MAFVDDLTFVMITLVLVAATVAYIVVAELFAYRRLGPKGLGVALRETAVPMIAVGLLTLVVGLWGVFTWPLPGSYNILFYDVYTLFGLIVLGFGTSVYLGFRLQYVGVLSIVSGTIVIAYGARAYQLGLTKEPWAMFLMYLGWGATAILAFPVALIADGWLQGAKDAASLPEPPRGKDGRPQYPVSYLRAAIVLLFVLVIVLSAIATYAILGNSIYTHLQSAP
jgi:putative membrane protein